jgi:hypothetical protein
MSKSKAFFQSIFGCLILLSLTAAPSVAQRTETNSNSPLTAIRYAADMTTRAADRGDCKAANAYFSTLKRLIPPHKMDDGRVSPLFEDAQNAVSACTPSDTEATDDVEDTTQTTDETEATEENTRDIESIAAGICSRPHKHLDDFVLPCQSRLDVGENVYACRGSEARLKRSTCAKAEPCGRHEERDTWRKNCGNGQTGNITYMCYMGGVHPVSDTCRDLEEGEEDPSGRKPCNSTTVKIKAQGDSSKSCSFSLPSGTDGDTRTVYAGSAIQGIVLEGSAKFKCTTSGVWSKISGSCHVVSSGEAVSGGAIVQ